MAVVPIAGCLVAAGDCELRGEGDWTGGGVVSIYREALRGVREAAPELERLAVHPQPRFLVEDERGGLRLGDFNRFGDPDFRRALADDSLAAPCELDEQRGCSVTEHPRHVILSEPVPVHRREAAVLVVLVDRTPAPGSSRTLILHLRHGWGEWRMSRTAVDGEGEGAPDWEEGSTATMKTPLMLRRSAA